MNAGDWQVGPKSNVMLNRNKAWTDPATGILASCGFLCTAPATYLPATFCAGSTVQWTERGGLHLQRGSAEDHWPWKGVRAH
jgi:hypothetical protein